MRRAVVLFLFFTAAALFCGSTAVCHQTTAGVNNNNGSTGGGGGGSRNIFLIKDDLDLENVGKPGGADEPHSTIAEMKNIEPNALESTVPKDTAEQSSREVPPAKPPKGLTTLISQTEGGNVIVTQPGLGDHHSSVFSSPLQVAKRDVTDLHTESEVDTLSVPHGSLADTAATTEYESKRDDNEEDDEHYNSDKTENKGSSEQNSAVRDDDDARKQSTSPSFPAEVNPTSTTTASNTPNDAACVDIFGTVRGPFVLFLLLLQITF